jgi:hypothetical protein
MAPSCCPFCHLVLVLTIREQTRALFECPACHYTVMVPVAYPPLVEYRRIVEGPWVAWPFR